ncbi:hypothetical protein [Pseudodesulfovibrio nedwellii]|nr:MULTISPECIES: hypothetical protein [Pseudodesulfovibrio]
MYENDTDFLCLPVNKRKRPENQPRGILATGLVSDRLQPCVGVG